MRSTDHDHGAGRPGRRLSIPTYTERLPSTPRTFTRRSPTPWPRPWSPMSLRSSYAWPPSRTGWRPTSRAVPSPRERQAPAPDRAGCPGRARCPCCGVTRVLDDAGRTHGAERDHFYSRERWAFQEVWLAYEHPFEDGNGRTARALFYWAMLRNGYWIFEFISISRFIKQAPGKYARAFLFTETDANDLTYFVVQQIEVILEAIDGLDSYIADKVTQVKHVEQLLESSTDLNHRQLALLAHAIRHPGAEYTVRSHTRSHDVAYATARADLLRLAELRLLDKRREGLKTNVFHVPPDIEARIRTLQR